MHWNKPTHPISFRPIQYHHFIYVWELKTGNAFLMLKLTNPNAARTTQAQKTINKAYLKEKTGRSAIELFKFADLQLVSLTNQGEDEQYLQKVVSNFRKVDGIYIYINTKHLDIGD